jgi:hypothetical protein
MCVEAWLVRSLGELELELIKNGIQNKPGTRQAQLKLKLGY